MPPDDSGSSQRSSRTLTLTTGGITLLGVLLSLGVTVGFGIKADWWVRVLAGVGTTLFLVVVVRLGTASGRGPLARLADWVIGGPAAASDRDERDQGPDGRG